MWRGSCSSSCGMRWTTIFSTRTRSARVSASCGLPLSVSHAAVSRPCQSTRTSRLKPSAPFASPCPGQGVTPDSRGAMAPVVVGFSYPGGLSSPAPANAGGGGRRTRRMTPAATAVTTTHHARRVHVRVLSDLRGAVKELGPSVAARSQSSAGGRSASTMSRSCCVRRWSSSSLGCLASLACSRWFGCTSSVGTITSSRSSAASGEVILSRYPLCVRSIRHGCCWFKYRHGGKVTVEWQRSHCGGVDGGDVRGCVGCDAEWS